MGAWPHLEQMLGRKETTGFFVLHFRVLEEVI